jgi:hypothetical protein
MGVIDDTYLEAVFLISFSMPYNIKHVFSKMCQYSHKFLIKCNEYPALSFILCIEYLR